MKSYELLDLIGEAGEHYVLEADGGETYSRPRWKIWAAAAACAALALCAYPVYKTASLPPTTEQNACLPLHDYTVVEGGGVLADEGPESITAHTTEGSADDTVSGGAIFSAPAVGGEPAADAGGPTADGDFRAHAEPFMAPAGDAPADTAGGTEPVPAPAPEEAALGIPAINQDAAIAQYQRLCRACSVDSNPPEWYAGAWLDNDSSDNVARLAVSIVDGYHTPELEAQIENWCGGGVVFVQDRKYSYARLKSMLDQINAALMDLQDETWSTFSFMRLDIMNNCLEIGFYGLPSDGALAFLAQLDPEGDAIRVQAFAGRVAADEQLTAEPTPTPRIEEPSAASTAPDAGENTQPAHTNGAGHSVPGSMVEDLPQSK